MKKLLLISLAIFFVICSRSWALPECEDSPTSSLNIREKWNQCIGKFFWDNGMNFVGEWKNGKWYKGTMVHHEGSTYVGEYRWDNEYEINFQYGFGTLYFSDGRVWQGQWKESSFVSGKKYAAGEYIEPVEVYEEPIQEKVIMNKMDIGEAKLQCKDIGFTEGTESFGQCVLDLTK